jgi:hypothetical protein
MVRLDAKGQVYAAVRSPAVPNGVFHQGLEDQARHPYLQRLGGDLAGDMQPLAETGALDLQITLYEG